MTSQTTRYREIDLFRAVAIMMVLGFHYMSRWTPPRFEANLYPYGNFYAENAFLSHGYLGVEFFFIISGFVIALTLENCRGAVDFAARRAARLLPAMIVCSLLTLIVVRFFLPVPPFREEANPWNLIPSWTFTEPYVWSKFLPVTSHIDGAYWSLVVEVKFYIWAAIIYFLQREKFGRNMFVFCAATSIVFGVGELLQIKPLQSLETYLLFGRYAMLFAAGVFFYQLHKSPASFRKLAPFFAACMALDLIRSALVPLDHTIFVVTATFKILFFVAFFAVAMGYQAPKNAVFDFIARIGIVSYPLYLLHQNIGVSILSLGIGVQSNVLLFAMFFGLCAAIIFVSFYLHKLVELPGKRLMLSLFFGTPQISPQLRNKT